ncbi:MAG: cell division protein FtsZ [Alphaproteobacteria bacterium]|jgi:cell division protein FtsZ|nr:cell division protein FtsZ [Alphaproteobacteria bacterium]
MPINLSVPAEDTELKPRIIVVGVGGAGGNAVNNMISANLEGVEFVVANTDAQAIANSLAERRIQLGLQVTAGLGAGARPDVGRAAAEEAYDEIVEHLRSSHMAFIAAGMGGGTGTGAAPVIARAAKELGILTVGVVTKPFQFEGSKRMRLAEAGINELQQYVDTLIVIPNQNLFRIANEKTTFTDAFRMADNVLHSGVRGITDLMVMPGLINLDFADVRSVMSEMGKAMMGTGEADGESRALEAAERAIANPLLDDISMKGARGVLINITGGPDLTLYEVDEAANRIRNEVDPDANIIVGSTLDDNLEGRMRVTVVATGIDAQLIEKRPPEALTTTHAVGSTPAAPSPVVTPFVRPAATLRPAAPAPAARTSVAMGGAATAAVAAPVAAPAVAEPAPEPVVAQLEAEPVAPAPVAAPEPVMVQPVAQQVAQPVAPRPAATSQAMLFREAEAQAAPKPRKISLSDKIFGFGRTAVPAQPMATPRSEPMVARAPQASMQAAPAAPAPAPQPQAAARPGLSGLDPMDRPVSANAAEDILAIPAFLRRQAN